MPANDRGLRKPVEVMIGIGKCDEAHDDESLSGREYRQPRGCALVSRVGHFDAEYGHVERREILEVGQNNVRARSEPPGIDEPADHRTQQKDAERQIAAATPLLE